METDELLQVEDNLEPLDIAEIPAELAVSLSAPPVSENELPFPHKSPLENIRVTSGFGPRISPITGSEEFHKGVDIAAADGEKIAVFAEGTVTFAGWSDAFAWYMVVSHESGYETRYLHCSELLAEAGDQVHAGEIIALAGSGGVSTGPHLHFELLREGRPIDPMPWIGG